MSGLIKKVAMNKWGKSPPEFLNILNEQIMPLVIAALAAVLVLGILAQQLKKKKK
jgi:hypothetical protein